MGDEEIVFKNTEPDSCTLYDEHTPSVGTDLACLRLICRMNDAEQKAYQDFVNQHANALE